MLSHKQKPSFLMFCRSGGSHLALNASFDMLTSLEVCLRMREGSRAA
jgi:hypothetical protein